MSSKVHGEPVLYRGYTLIPLKEKFPEGSTWRTVRYIVRLGTDEKNLAIVMRLKDAKAWVDTKLVEAPYGSR